MKQLEALGTGIEHGLEGMEARTASPVGAALLGVALALTTTIGGLIALVVILKVSTAVF